MNARNLTLLLLAAGAAVAAAAIALKGGGSRAEAPATAGVLLPGLEARANDVAAIRIQRASGGYTLKRSGDRWTLEDRGGYPVQIEAVRKTVNALLAASLVEPKTADPARYAKLGVEDFDAPDSKSTLVTLLDASGRDVARLVVGKEAEASGFQGSGQRYVRRAGEAQSWLANLKLELHDKPTDWLAKEILKITQDRVRAIEIRQPDGETLLVDRASPDQRDFQLHGIPEGQEPTYPTVANSLGTGLEYVNLEDVLPASDVDFSSGTGPIARFDTFDGLVVTVTTKDQDGKSFATFAASYEEPPAASPPTSDGADAPPAPARRPAEEVRAEVDALNARLAPWVFQISSYNRSQFGKKLSEVVRAKAPPPSIAAPGDEDGGESDEDQPMVIPGDLPPEIQAQIKADLESRGEKAVIGPARKKAEPDPGATPHDGAGEDDGAGASDTPRDESASEPENEPADDDGAGAPAGRGSLS